MVTGLSQNQERQVAMEEKREGRREGCLVSWRKGGE